jgi:hypothetical protein
MHLAGRLAAAMLLTFIATSWGSPEADAASRAKSVCSSSTQATAKSCASLARRAARQRALPRRGAAGPRVAWPRGPRRRLYQGNEGAMAQLPFAARPLRASTLRFDDRGSGQGDCDRNDGPMRSSRSPCGAHLGLPEALLQPPGPATRKTLLELGSPIIPDVPPIVILRPETERDIVDPSLVTP